MSNNSPEISVLLPVYNTNPTHLKESIESILNQTFSDFELIIINDASTKNLDEIINSYNDDRIKYYKNEKNLGITKTRNKLLSLANGKYIAIADHDDISVPERFEKEYCFLEKNYEYSVVSGWIETFNEITGKKKVWKKMPFPKLLDYLKESEILHPACMWRKADFEKFNLKYEDDYFGAQDYAMFAKAARYLKGANIQEVLLKYRKHKNNVSNQRQKICIDTEKIQNEILDFLTYDKNLRKKIFDQYAFPKVSFKEKIFSMKNTHNYKLIRIFGFLIKIKLFKTNQ